MITALLAALKFAPTVFSVGKKLFEATTGEPTADDETPETLAAMISELPPEQRVKLEKGILETKAEIQRLDTDRFLSMNEGDAAKVAASARPEAMRQAMSVITIFAKCFAALIIFTFIEWALRFGFGVFDKPYPGPSLWALIAEAQPVAEMIWGPLVASFGVCASIALKYMGCRERDKAQQYEMQAGRPLNAAAATVEAAGSGLANIIKAVRGR